MRTTLAIVRREFATYFLSPIPYLILAVYLALAGVFLYFTIADGADASVRPLVPTLSVILMILTPALTMRLLAEERKSGTLEVMLTDPVTEWQLVLGKFLGCLLFFALLVSVLLVYGLVFEAYGDPDWVALGFACVGLVLYGGAMIGIGLFLSSLTRNQVVAYVTAFVALLALFLVDDLAGLIGGEIGRIGSAVGVQQHWDSFRKGILDTRDVVYFVSIAALSLFLSVRVAEARRWK